MNQYDLSGRVALVTGASSGIGAYLCAALARAGAKVVAAARRKDRLDELVARIQGAGGTAIALPLDVASEASTSACYDAAEAAFGTVDTIYANAGINMPGQLSDIAIADFESMLATNVKGALLTARIGANRLRSGPTPDRGRIIIIGSVTGYRPFAAAPGYSISKAAVMMTGRALAQEYAASGINVNVLCPGAIKTDLNTAYYESDAGRARIASLSRRRLMAIEDLEELLLFLGSNGSRCVTGSVFKIDDGQLPDSH